MDNMYVEFKVLAIGQQVATFLLNTFRFLKAIDLCKECLVVLNNNKVMGVMDRSVVEALFHTTIYTILFQAYLHIGDFANAIQYGKELLFATRKNGFKVAEGNITYKLAEIYKYQSKYAEAKELFEKAIIIMRETGDRKGETDVYCHLGELVLEFGKYEKAKEYLEKAIKMKIEINDKKGEASCYIGLSNVFINLADNVKVEEYCNKALAIQMETGDRYGEGNAYLSQGVVFMCRGDLVKAKEYFEKALAKMIEARDRAGESTAYSKLGGLFQQVGELDKAEHYYKKALDIRKKIGDRKGEGNMYGSLAVLYDHFCQYAKAKEYLKKELAIAIEIGNRKGEATVYLCLGNVFQHLEEHDKADEYFEKALAIQKKTGDRRGEAASYLVLGKSCIFRGKYVNAEGLVKKALSISDDIDDGRLEWNCYCNLALAKLAEGKIFEAVTYLILCITKCEDLRGFLKDNDQFNISFSDVHANTYGVLCTLFCDIGNTSDALHVVELGRARALADLMKTQYSVEEQIPQPWFVRVERIMRKECQSSCLYISYSTSKMFLWILKTTGVIHYREVEISRYIVHDGSVQILDDIFEGSFRGYGIFPVENCEDRSLNNVQPKSSPAQEESTAGVRIVEENDDTQDHEPNLALYYKMIIAPVVDLLEESEIIIVPERSLYRVPFPALFETLSNGRIKYLSESYRIRIVPSLTTLELIQNSPADYHSQSDELIVGDPDVGRVMYKGKIVNITQLYHAGKEAKMIGQLLGAQPLIGQHATKQAVLQRIRSVRLTHIAAHGSAERGEIALAPLRTSNMIPQEEEYLLTMSDISKAQLRAKLVVLSCCHSGRGQIRAEGVVGIARAFLGSGARSVLVALWALSDSATKQFMCRFYKNLVGGESASESLHEAMKWMRANGYSDVGLWAPFMLIGDDVTFDFSK